LTVLCCEFVFFINPLNWNSLINPKPMDSLKSSKIFIVDDDSFWRLLLKSLLQELGYTNTWCFDSTAACLESISLNPAIVFLDYHMKGADGMTALKKIKAYDEQIIVIFLTASEDWQVAVNALKGGSFDYLVKTHIEEQDILSVLEKIEQHQSQAGRIL